MCGVTVHAVRKWRQQKLITFIMVNNHVMFERTEVLAFIERHRRNAEARAC